MSIQAMKQALEMLRLSCPSSNNMDRFNDAITALRAAIEAAEKQEPVAYVDALTCSINFCGKAGTLLPSGTLLYATPQPAIPAGYALVPVEPTHDMMLVMEHFANSDQTYPDGWKAMLAAAPKPEGKP